MRKRLTHLMLLSLALAACTDDSENLGSGSHGVLVDNRIASNRISSNRISSNRISSNRISSNRISTDRYTANEATMGDLLDTPGGLELLAFLIGCALPEGTTLVATDPHGGPDIEFYGEVGIAAAWVDRALTETDRRWVSACMLSRVNDNNVTVEVSMRGPHSALDSTPAERTSHTAEEGAFYGDIFGPVDKPLQWFACRGEDQAAGETGGLNDRDCAEPDPSNKGYTQCGFIYTGDCSDYVVDKKNDKYACGSFSLNGYYEACETKPTHNHHRTVKNHKQYEEVITTFLVP